MRKFFLLIFLIPCLGFITNGLQATAILSKQGCNLRANTTVQGFLDRCPRSAYPAGSPYRFKLQQSVNGSFVEIDNSGWTSFPSFDFPLYGLGTFRVVAEVWQSNGFFQVPFGSACNGLQRRVFTSSAIQVTSTKEWVSYPLVGGDNADEFMALRHFSSENSYYHVSNNRLWENRWTGSSWARSQVAPSPAGSFPGSDDVHGPVACVPGNSSLSPSAIYYVNNNSTFGRFTRNSMGVYTISFVSGSYPVAFKFGQIAAGGEGPIYANGSGKVWLLSQITNNEVEVSSVVPFSGGRARAHVVRTTDGTVVYSRETGDLVAANLTIGGTAGHSYSLNGTSGNNNVSDSELATDGTNVFYRANNGSVWIWPRNSNGTFGTPFQLPGLFNCDGYLAASPERPMEVFYKANSGRMWTIKFESSTGWRQMPMADVFNVKGPVIAKTKVAYRNTSNTIWHEYEVNCSGKKDASIDFDAPEVLTVTAFPNPATDHLTVRIETPLNAEGDLALYDLTGRMVRQLTQNHAFNAGSHEVELSVSDLPTGTYLLRWTGGGEVTTVKVSIQ